MAAELPLELDDRQMRTLGAAAVDLAAEFVGGIPEMPSDLDGAYDAAAALREPAPERGAAPDEVLDVVRRGALKSFNSSGPGMFGYVPGSGLYSAAIAEFLTAATNRFVALSMAAPVFAQIEATAVRWLSDICGYPATAHGVLTSGGTMSVFSGLVTARIAKLGDDPVGGVLYVSDQTHHAAAKSARLAGLPAWAVRMVPTRADLTMDVEALERCVADDLAAGLRPFCVVASAGTTNTGAVDPLPEIADLCERHGLWMHADGAYGGAFLLTERGRAAMRGIERADSITLDPHKGLFLPYGTGALLVRDGARLRAANSLDAVYLQDVTDQPEIPDIADYSTELTRECRGLRLWLPIKLHGLAAFRDALDEKLDLARAIHDELATVPGIELPWEPTLSTVAFRFAPPGADADAETLRLLDRINATGRVYLSSTTIRDRVHLRICVLSVRTHADRVQEAVAIVRAAAAELSTALAGTAGTGLSCRVEDRAPEGADDVLAVVGHGRESTTPVLGAAGPTLHVAIPEALGPNRVQVWRTGRPVECGQDDEGLVHAHDGRYLFCAVRIPHDRDYADAVEKSYLRILDVAERMGYPRIARMWNVVGGITAPVAPGTDRYRLFCQARGRAFAGRGLTTERMPAATGIGGQDHTTTVHLLATSCDDVVNVENPRQLPAFRYPARYGVQPPSFARATVVGSEELFVSGTASILGHRTVHPGDVRAQTLLTLENIAELVSGRNLAAHGVDAALQLQDLDCVTVYVKHPADVEAVRATCAGAFGPRTRVVLAVADVCRDDLLVEIEAFASLSHR